jgi:hypothetical protein
MASYQQKPIAAFVLSLISGLIIFFMGIFLSFIGAIATVFIGGIGGIIGVFGIVWGALLIIGAVLMYSRPDQHVIWGILVIVLSILSWVGAAGGLIIGFLFGFIGGILAIIWNPPAS